MVAPDTGEPLLSVELASGPGLRLASGVSITPDGAVCYCNDLFSVHAIVIERALLDGRPALRARVRSRGAAFPTESFQRDPESLRRIIAVIPIGPDVLVLRDDGRMTRFDATAGAVRATWELGRVSDHRWSADSRTAALATRQGGDCTLRLLRAEDATAARDIPLGAALPLRVIVAERHVAAIWLDRAEVITVTDPADRRRVQLPGPALAATASLIDGARVADQSGVTPPMLCYVDLSGVAHGIDVTRGQAVWQLALPRAADVWWERSHTVAGGWALGARRHLLLFDPYTGVVSRSCAVSQAPLVFEYRTSLLVISDDFAGGADPVRMPIGSPMDRTSVWLHVGKAPVLSCSLTREYAAIVERGAVNVYRLRTSARH